MQSAAVGDRAAKVAGLQDLYGPLFGRAMKELTEAGLNPRYRALAGARDNPALARTIARALEPGGDGPEQALDPAGSQEVRGRVHDLTADARPGAEPGGEMADAIVSAAEALGVEYLRQSGRVEESAARAAAFANGAIAEIRLSAGEEITDAGEDDQPAGGEGDDTLIGGDVSQSVPGGPAPKTYPTDDGRNPIFKRFRKNLAHFEKGFVNRKTDPGGPTNKGISQKFLDRLNRRHPEWKLPKNTGNLKKDHIDGIFRSEFFDRPKIQDVVDIPGLMQQAPQLPEQLFDAGVLHGTQTAGTLLQKSLDEHLGTDLRVTKNGKKVYDGNVGPLTRAAIARAIKEGMIKAVNDTMVKKRIQFMRNLPTFKHNPGWVPRAKSFRIGSPGGP